MTLEEFEVRLRETMVARKGEGKWNTMGASTRFYPHGTYETQCPISFLANRPCQDAWDVAQELGLSFDDTLALMFAADHAVPARVEAANAALRCIYE
jgi:hypothetical protein